MEEFNYKEILKHPFPTGYKSPGSTTDKNDKDSIPKLFTPFTIKDMTLKNRIAVSPMCQYSSKDGFMNDWHLVHLGTFAKGGASLIVFEATSVTEQGRISYLDSGIWKDDHIEPLKRIVDFIHQFDCKTGIQIAHAGRKASMVPPFLDNPRASIPPEHELGWQVGGPSSVAWSPQYPVPHEYSIEEIKDIINSFKLAAERVLKAGFDMIEIHGAHGYLIDSFLSPTSNKRTDEYGMTFEGRCKFLLDIVVAVKSVWPESKPLSVRLSCEEWVPEGIHIDDTLLLAQTLKKLGVDILDCSSGGNSYQQKIKMEPLYQVPFSRKVKQIVSMPTIAVGLIESAKDAELVLQQESSDLIMIARSILRDPFWPIHAAIDLGIDVDPTLQYLTSKK
eukprot:gene3912-4885_t